jgi:hypothetical protein
MPVLLPLITGTELPQTSSFALMSASILPMINLIPFQVSIMILKKTVDAHPSEIPHNIGIMSEIFDDQ